MQVLFIFNELAARVRHSRIDRLEKAFRKAGHEVSRVDSHDERIGALALLSDFICVIGGDGTVRDAIERLPDLPPHIRLAVYPLGTINLLAREVGYVADCNRFVDRVTAETRQGQYYVANMNEGTVLVCASVGPDSAAVAGVDAQMKRRFGRFAYALSAMQMLYRWPRHQMNVVVDGESHKCEAAYLLNGRYYAGPWTLDSRADLREPSMRVLMLPTARRRDYFRLMLSTMVHPSLGDRRWKRLTGSNVEILSPLPLPVQADGDIRATLPVNISVSPRAVAFG